MVSGEKEELQSVELGGFALDDSLGFLKCSSPWEDLEFKLISLTSLVSPPNLLAAFTKSPKKVLPLCSTLIIQIYDNLFIFLTLRFYHFS